MSPAWLTYIGLFPGDIMEWMPLSACSVKLLHDAGSLKEYCIPLLGGYEEDIIAGDASISFGELSPAAVRTISNCTTFECPAAYARGN